MTGAAVAAGGRVTDVLHRGLTQGVGEAQGAGAGEPGVPPGHYTAPPVLTDLLPGTAGVGVLAVLSNILRRASSEELVSNQEILLVDRYKLLVTSC